MNNMYDILNKFNSVVGKQTLTEGWKGELAGGTAGGIAGSIAGNAVAPGIGGIVGGALGATAGGMAGRAIGDAVDESEQLNEIAPMIAAGARFAKPVIDKLAQVLSRGGKAAADTAGKVGSATVDAAGKAATGVGRGVADVSKEIGKAAVQNAPAVGMGIGAYEIAKQFADKMPSAANMVYDDVTDAAKAITSVVGDALGSATVMELATAAVKYALPVALILGVLYGGKKLIDKLLSEDAMMEESDMRGLLNKLDYVAEGWKGTAAGAGLGALAGGPIGAAVGALAGDKIGDEMEEGKKPDFLDLDKDGDRKEPMKQAAQQADKVDEAASKTARMARIAKTCARDAGSNVDRKMYLKAAELFAAGDEQRGLDAIERMDTEARDYFYMDCEKAGIPVPVDEGSTGDYSAKKARAGKDIGKPGKQFAKISKSAGERYGSKERGEKVAGAVLAKLRAKESVAEGDVEEGNDFTGARLAAIKAGKPTFRVDGKVYKVTGDTSDEKVMEREFHTRDEFDDRAEPGDTYKKGNMTITKTKGGIHVRHETDYDPGKDDADDDGAPKKKGRPKGSKRAIGAKVKGTSKLHSKPAIAEDDMEGVAVVDRGEYDREGDMAREQLHTVMDAAKELHDILDSDENLPEWVQSKITKAVDYLDTARDYVKASDAEDAEEIVPERKLTKPEMKKREEIVKSMKKSKGDFEKRYGERGEEVMYATATKQAKKKAEESKDKEEVEETTVAGSVATAPADVPKGKKGGMQFGKGVYEGYEKQFNQLLTEGMSINASQGEDGKKSLTVTATDDDAVKLAQILHLAGMPQGQDYHGVCPACGQSPCGCEEELEEAELANSPEPEYSDVDTMINTLGAGLNGRKSTGQTTLPVINRDPKRQVSIDQYTEAVVNEAETKLWDLYKRYENR